MSIFSKKKPVEETKAAPKAVKKAPVVKAAKVKATPVAKKMATMNDTLVSVIIRPRITEKATLATESDTYLFDVSMNATKHSIGKAIEALYKVSPRKVNIVRVPAKQVMSRGKRGVTSATKKAYVFLRKGEKIEFV